MALLLIASLYALVWFVFSLLVPIDMSNGVRLAFNIVGGISALVLPIVIYSFIDFYLSRRTVQNIGKEWCKENDKEYIKVDMFKNHFALVYKQNGKKERKKFRIRYVLTTWILESVEWL